MKYEIKRTSKFKDDFKKALKRGCDIEKFKIVLSYLANGEIIPEKYKDHPLTNSKMYKDLRELHIEPDWLLIYKYSYNNLILYLVRTGTHSDLFK